jgi:uncharacterized phiE125 gp8 family phage protein
MTEPVALEDLKVHLRLDASATDEDDYLNVMIVAARRACELRINRSILGADLTKTLDQFPSRSTGRLPTLPIEAENPGALDIVLEGGSVIGNTISVRYRDASGQSQTVDPASYVADTSRLPARLGPLVNWPIAGQGPGAVTVAYSVSELDPDDLEVAIMAMLLIIGHWYANREATAVDVRGTPAELPLSATWLLEPLRSWATE